jgi:integrative and conjugative element protein (TIGR02256 family)
VIDYALGHSGQRLVFSDVVVARFERHRQTKWYHREAGGQLFARVRGDLILVDGATGPRWRDRRTRHTYEPHRPSEQREIDAHHRRDLHFVGDWHTHAEPTPQPSPTDLLSMSEAFRRSRHSLNAFLMVIVGTAALPDGMVVFACDAHHAHALSRIPEI